MEEKKQYADYFGSVHTSGGMKRGYTYQGVYYFKNILYGKTGRIMTHIHQPGKATCLKRISEDSYIRNSTYDLLEYLNSDPQGILLNECSQIAWHAGYYDDEVFGDGSCFYDGDQRYFEMSPLIDIAMLCSDGFVEWVKRNKVELVA